MTGRRSKLMKILKIKITTDSKQEILQKVVNAISSKEKLTIFTPNPEMIEFASRSLSFSELLNTGDINLPDGQGLKIACNLKNLIDKISNFSLHTTNYPPTSLREALRAGVLRTPVIHGIDFMLNLCREAEIQDWTIGLLGGLNGAAEKTKEKLLEQFPKLKIGYVYGDFKYNPNQFSTTHNPQPTTSLDLLFVALGTPKEQLWISENKNSFPSTVFMEVGGSFDIISGKLKRAPHFMQTFDMEWLFRLIQEPKRLHRQINLIKFLLKVLTTKNSVEI
jgi:N-acetylglucosaminyldiphosphoundecaprenol N-acetyl-beta-D-mannosaminyltransferase